MDQKKNGEQKKRPSVTKIKLPGGVGNLIFEIVSPFVKERKDSIE